MGRALVDDEGPCRPPRRLLVRTLAGVPGARERGRWVSEARVSSGELARAEGDAPRRVPYLVQQVPFELDLTNARRESARALARVRACVAEEGARHAATDGQ